jgi:hypothetical protein
MMEMTPEEREAFYDAEVAPELLRLAGLCEDRGISLVALAEWEPGETGRTVTIAKDASFQPRLVDTAIRSHGNVDTLVLALMRYATEHGHSSACMHLLGVPRAPAVDAPAGGARDG